MRVLVTGSAGCVGHAVVEDLLRTGHEVAPFDLGDGSDVCDEAAVARAVTGVEAVVHLAALNEDAPATQIMATNVGGTWNVLSAAADQDIDRVVFASSVNSLGVFRGRRPPDYFPIDDDHPTYATSAYGHVEAARRGAVRDGQPHDGDDHDLPPHALGAGAGQLPTAGSASPVGPSTEFRWALGVRALHRRA